MKTFARIFLVIAAALLWALPAFSQGQGSSFPCQAHGTLVSAHGLGKLPPGETNPMKARLLAVRAAKVEARRNLLSCLSRGTAPPGKDLEGRIKAAVVTDIMIRNDGSVVVTVTLDTKWDQAVQGKGR